MTDPVIAFEDVGKSFTLHLRGGVTGNELLWYVSRGSGLAAIVVLTTVLMIGTWGPVRRQERSAPARRKDWVRSYSVLPSALSGRSL